MYVYLYHIDPLNKIAENSRSRFTSTEFSNHMVLLARKDYIRRAGLVLPQEEQDAVRVLRDPKGKPYFEGCNGIFFSISHSENWWGCLMADEKVGFDLEAIRYRKNFEGIAARFFTEEEHQYVVRNGLSGFFEIWVRKEAYVKYLGTGLSEGLRTFSVATKETLLQEVRIHRQIDSKESYILGLSEISSELKAAYCCKSGNAISQTILLGSDNQPEAAYKRKAVL